jgi:uncharacterized protein YabN with tetrapyrrole methylase and pyrophosphatase domain
MQKALMELVESLQKYKRQCPWGQQQSFEAQLAELQSEVEELKEALERNDSAEIIDEYGDVLGDVLLLGIIAEDKGFFSIKEAIEKMHAKLRRRAPWVFGKEKIATREEAIKRWNEIKQLERAEKKK